MHPIKRTLHRKEYELAYDDYVKIVWKIYPELEQHIFTMWESTPPLIMGWVPMYTLPRNTRHEVIS